MGLFSCKCDEYDKVLKEKEDYRDKYIKEMDKVYHIEMTDHSKLINAQQRANGLFITVLDLEKRLAEWTDNYEKKEIIWKQRYLDLEEKYRKLILDKVNEDEKKDRLTEETQTS